MDLIGPVGLVIIISNVYVTYKGLSSYRFFNKYSFTVGDIQSGKEYLRLVSSGFLHVSWLHLLFNMMSLYCFSGALEDYFGPFKFVLIYLASLIGGNLLALLINRNNGDYSAVGASGAVSGVVFSAIVLDPEIRVGLFFMPSIPGWAFAFLYVLISIYGIRSKTSNIGHDAHLGGALVGLATTILVEPWVIKEHYLTIALIMIPCLFFIFKIMTKPTSLFVGNYYNDQNYLDIDEKYSYEKMQQQKELDRILDKIYTNGIKSLSKKEKDTLDSHSQR